MNEEDLRDCCAMFIANGMISRASAFDWKEIWDMADAMVEARRINDDDGIVSIKKRTRKPK
jgi:hypothetical protein